MYLSSNAVKSLYILFNESFTNNNNEFIVDSNAFIMLSKFMIDEKFGIFFNNNCIVGANLIKKTLLSSLKDDSLLSTNSFSKEEISMKKYESAPLSVTEFTAEVKAKTKGRLELQLVFENGKKEWIKIKEFYNDEDMITAMKTAIIAESSGAFGISSKVSSVNATFVAA